MGPEAVPKDRVISFTDGVLAIAATLILLELPPVDSKHGQDIVHYIQQNSEGAQTAVLVICSIFFLWQSHQRSLEDRPDGVSLRTFYMNYVFCFVATTLPVSFDFALFFPHTQAVILPAAPLSLAGLLLVFVGHIRSVPGGPCRFRYKGDHWGLAYELVMPIWALLIGVAALIAHRGEIWFALLPTVTLTRLAVHLARKHEERKQRRKRDSTRSTGDHNTRATSGTHDENYATGDLGENYISSDGSGYGTW